MPDRVGQADRQQVFGGNRPAQRAQIGQAFHAKLAVQQAGSLVVERVLLAQALVLPGSVHVLQPTRGLLSFRDGESKTAARR